MMSDKQNNYSLDDILNGIRLEREKKAGLRPADDAAPADDKTKRVPDVTKAEKKSAAEADEPDDGSDPLISAYLTKQEIDESRKAAEEKAKRRTALEEQEEALKAMPENDGESDDGQIKLNDFDDGDLHPEIISEVQAERELKKKRKEDIELFRMFSEKLVDESLLQREQREQRRGKQKPSLIEQIEAKKGNSLFDEVDHVEKKKKKKHTSRFFVADSPAEKARKKAENETKAHVELNVKKLRKQLVRTYTLGSYTAIIAGLITGMLLLLAVLPEFYHEGGMLTGLLGGSGRSYLALNFALMIAALIVSYNDMRSSVQSLIKLSPNSDVCVMIAMIFAALQNLVLLIKGNFIANDAVLYNSVAAFILLLNSLSKLFSTHRMLNSLKALNDAKELRAVQPIENRADANQLAYGLRMSKQPEILYSTEVEIPDEFYELSSGRAEQERFFTYVLPVTILLGIIFGIIGSIVSKNTINFITGYTGCLCVCMPVSMAFINDLLIAAANSPLNKKGCAVLGFDGISGIDKANAVIMDASDVCYASVTNFHCIKNFCKMEDMEAVAYTGAVLTKGSGVLSSLFRDIIIRQKLSLPPVEGLKFEDRLGYGAWVGNELVLVGNREMMKQHNVQMPNMPELADDNKNGTAVLFMAVEGKLAASFDVTYHLGKHSAKQIKKLTDNGVVLMLLTADADITEEFVAQSAGISADSVKIANSKSRDIMRMYSGTGARKKSSSILYKPAVGAQLRSINAAFSLVDACRQAFLIQFAGLVFAAGVCLAVNLLGSPSVLSPLIVILYQSIWALLAYVISSAKLRKK